MSSTGPTTRTTRTEDFLSHGPGAYPQDVVDTAVRPPATPPLDDASIRRPRRRWLWWLIAALLVVLLATVSTGLVLVANYQPFRPGYKQYGPPPGLEVEVTRVNWLGMPPNLRIFKVPTEDGLTFRYRFSIWNHGPVPITVTRFGVPASEQEPDSTLVPVAVDPNVYGGGQWIPVQPVRLAPRQVMGIEMEVTVASCMSGVRWNEIPLTFEMYGIERHVFAPTNVQIDLVRSASCP
jgi:hypothetical protein